MNATLAHCWPRLNAAVCFVGTVTTDMMQTARTALQITMHSHVPYVRIYAARFPDQLYHGSLVEITMYLSL